MEGGGECTGKKRNGTSNDPSYYCCFGNCRSNNLNHGKFYMVPPLPPKPKGEVLAQYITYHSELIKRKEVLDICGLKGNIVTSNYQYFSQSMDI